METIRDFVVCRHWLVGPNRLFSYEEYEALKRRELPLPRIRIDYMLAFIDGWKSAKA
jgi:hypothetical protein